MFHYNYVYISVNLFFKFMELNELLQVFLRELEEKKGCPVQLKVESLDGNSEYLGAFEERPVTVYPVSGDGAEFVLAQVFAGRYGCLKQLQGYVAEVEQRIFSTENVEKPLNIHRFFVGKDNISVLTMGTYGKEGVLQPHPGHESKNPPYEIKIADVKLDRIQ